MITLRNSAGKLYYAVKKPRVLRILDELNELQWLSHDALVARQLTQLHNLLEYANAYVPYYRDLFKKVGFHPSDFAADPTTFNTLPMLTKRTIRENRERLITTEESRRRSLDTAKTGGTTGEPLWLMQGPVFRDFNTAHIYHKMSWSGWQMGEPQAWLWGHSVLDRADTAPAIDRLKNRFANRLESNAFHMTEVSLEAFSRQLEDRPGCVLWSYVSTMYEFAQFLQQRGHRIQARAAYTSAEMLTDHQRTFIEEVLGCQVFNNYSCVEIGSIACECPQHQGLHITMRNCYVEILRDGKPAPDGEEGEFVLTNLTNYGFPLIRYQIEDTGRKSDQGCPCGRRLPMLDIVAGRIIDHFKTRDGRIVWGAFLIPMVPSLGSIKQYQIVQKSVDQLVFRVIKDGPIREDKFNEIRSAVKAVLGANVEATLEFVDDLPSTPTGKHRYTISEVN
jgi:phenylacetate-CoA ligase